jgi:integrase
MKLPRQWPKVVQRGHAVVKVYRTPCSGWDQFTIVYYLGERRIRKAIADYGKALTEAETVATKLSEGELNVVELKGKDRLAYVRAVEAIKPTGIPLEMAALHFAEAFRILGSENLAEAARFYVKHHPSHLPRKTVAEVVDELIAAKEADRLSDVYVQHLRSRLLRFQEAFPTRISLVTTGDIDRFLRELKSKIQVPGKGVQLRPASPKSRNHFQGSIGTLFYFAEARGYIPKGLVDIESLAMAKRTGGTIEIFRVDELVRALNTADSRLVPFLTIGAFAGLRHAEIQRLDWSEVRLDDAFIEVKAEKAKTASPRLVPITANLKAWSLPHRQPHGPVCPYVNMPKQLAWLAEKVDQAWKKEEANKVHARTNTGESNPVGRGHSAGSAERGDERWFKWKHNALRHSFISYRVADIQNVAQVALEAGNSPQMIFKSYRELVRPADAKAWFSIVPGGDGKIIELPQDKQEVKTQEPARTAEAVSSN